MFTKVTVILALCLLAAAGCCNCPQVVVVATSAGESSAPPLVDCDLPESFILPMERANQERSMICWAASGQMVMRLLGAEIPQCQQVADQQSQAATLGPATPCDCLACPASAAVPIGPCNNGGWPNFEAYGFKASILHGALPLGRLKREIACRHSPVAFSWKDDSSLDGGGHMMVAYGYQDDMIAIMDPKSICGSDDLDDISSITYAEYVNGNVVGGSHWDDFWAIRRGQP